MQFCCCSSSSYEYVRLLLFICGWKAILLLVPVREGGGNRYSELIEVSIIETRILCCLPYNRIFQSLHAVLRFLIYSTLMVCTMKLLSLDWENFFSFFFNFLSFCPELVLWNSSHINYSSRTILHKQHQPQRGSLKSIYVALLYIHSS